MLEKVKAFLQAMIGGVLPGELGRSPGFIGLAAFQVLLAFILIRSGADVSYLAAIYGSINVPVYAAGAWKASSDNKAATTNGVSNGAPK